MGRRRAACAVGGAARGTRTTRRARRRIAHHRPRRRSGVILAVALNPALDLTYELDVPLRVGRVNRVTAVHVRPGGKALNVARVLVRDGRAVMIVGPCGGATGQSLVSSAAAYDVNARWVPIAGETRRTLAVWEPP